MDNVRLKPKRQRKRQSRTEVASDSESEDARPVVTQEDKVEADDKTVSRRKPASRQRQSVLAETVVPEIIVPELDPKTGAAFKRYYMQKIATELSEDLDQLRSADDFNDAALPVLVKALEQGVSMFSPEEQQRLVEYSQN